MSRDERERHGNPCPRHQLCDCKKGHPGGCRLKGKSLPGKELLDPVSSAATEICNRLKDDPAVGWNLPNGESGADRLVNAHDICQEVISDHFNLPHSKFGEDADVPGYLAKKLLDAVEQVYEKTNRAKPQDPGMCGRIEVDFTSPSGRSFWLAVFQAAVPKLFGKE